MSKLATLKELWRFLRQRKRYWVLPLITLLLLFSTLLVLTEASAMAPVIYTLF